MLQLLGQPKRFCDGYTRREWLTVGAAAGLTLAEALRWGSASAASLAAHTAGRFFGRAKSCILLFLYGSPSQLEWADMKPQAPADYRGEFKPIASAVPGLEVCELLLRYYKPVPERLRPTDRMVAHTGYLIFARPMLLAASRPVTIQEDDMESDTLDLPDDSASFKE